MAEADNKTPQYIKDVDARGVVRYKLNGQLVKGSEVPEAVKAQLETVEPGTGVDAPASAPDAPETPAQAQSQNQGTPTPDDDISEDDLDDADEGSEGDGPEEDEGEEDDDFEIDDTPPAPAVATPKKTAAQKKADQAAEAKARKDAGIDSEDDVDDESGEDDEVVAPTESRTEEGMGFPRKNGLTVDIFNGKPHTQVRNVNGLMVPLTDENYKTKTDSEIVAKLKKMKKL